MNNIIEIKNVSKEFKVLNRREGLKGGIMDLFSGDYKIVKAVDDVSLSVKQGEIVGYLGPNGAGKSTTIKMMTGVLQPTSGDIRVNGRIPYDERTRNCQEIGVVFGQRSQLWWALPLIESFKILKDIYKVSDKDYEDMMEFYRSQVNLDEILHKPVRQMSLGQRTLSDILAAFLHNPGVVFLDEPTIGLDVSMKAKIRELIKALNKEKNTTVILTTHDMGDVDALCHRIVIIDKGRMLYDDDIEQLSMMFGAYRTLSLKLLGKKDIVTEDRLQELKRSVEIIIQTAFGQYDEQTCSVSINEDQIDIFLDENKLPLMNVLQEIRKTHKVYDIHIQEISTESVIRKIYDGVALN